MFTPTEILGYVATAVTLLSFLQEEQTRLRIVNLIGAGLWIGYGMIIGATPLIIVNTLIAVFHLRWLFINR